MTQAYDHQSIDEIVVRELEDYQKSLDGESNISTDQIGAPLPPEALERIRRAKSCLAALHVMAKNRGGSEATPIVRETQHRPKAIGRFEIRSELGVGGFGIVYRAYDPLTHREVALKIPRLDALASEDLRKRFEVEAAAAGKLDHPNIVPVLEAGSAGIIPYIASVYYEGANLAVWMHQNPSSIPPRAAADIVRQLALAVENAHSHGVLHRDIKPSNVLLALNEPKGARNELMSYTPKLMDFGLAKVAEIAGDMTKSGAILGTVRYMAPEQAKGNHNDITTVTDVYALGGILFELLAGRPAFEGDLTSTVLLKVIHDEAPDVRICRKDAPLDLAVVVAKCLAKTKADRYPSAQELAEELDRYLNGIPIKARPALWWERLFKWTRRHPARAAAAMLGLLFPLTILGLSLWGNGVLLEKNREIFEKNREIVQRLYSADMRSAKQALDEHRIEEASAILRKYEPTSGSPDVRTTAWELLASQIKSEAVTEWKYHDVDIYSIAISPDKKLLATASRDGTACLWKYGTNELVHRLVGHERDVNVVLFSPDGTRVATCGDDGTIRLWETTTGKSLHIISAHQGEVSSLVFSKDGKQLASGSLNGTVRLWDSGTGAEIRTVCSAEGAIDSIAYSPDGQSLIIASKSKLLFRINTETGETIWQISGETSSKPRLVAIDILSHMDLIVGGGSDGNVWYIDLKSGEVRQSTHRGGSPVSAIAILPNESEAITADQTGRLERWTILADGSALPIRAGRSRVWSIVAVETDDTVLTANASGFVRVERIHANQPSGIRSMAVLYGGIEEMYASPKSNHLYTIGGHTLASIDPKNGRFLRAKRDFPTKVWALAVNEEESMIATGEQSGRVCLWIADSFEFFGECPTIGPTGNERIVGIESIRFVPGKTWVVYVTDSDRQLKVWDYVQKSMVFESSLDGGTAHDITFMPDGRILVACRHALYGFRPTDHAYEPFMNESAFSSAIGIRPISNESFVVCRSAGELHLLHTPDCQQQYKIRLGPTSMTGIDVSPSREWIVVSGTVGEVFLIHTSKLMVFNTTVVRDAGVRSVCFSNDESEIYAGLDDGRIIVLKRHREQANEYVKPITFPKSMSVSPASNLIALHNHDSAIDLVESVSVDPVMSWLERDFERASFSIDGSQMILTKQDHLYSADVNNLAAEPKPIGNLVSPALDIIHLSNTKLLIRGDDQALRMIDLADRSKDSVFWKTSGLAAERIALSSDREQLAAATSDRKLRLWNLRDKRNLVVDARDTVRSIAFTPDGKNLAVGGEHGAIDVLNLQTKNWGEPLINSGNVQIRSLEYTDDGKTIFAASSAGGVQIWDVETREVIYSLDTDLKVEDIVISQKGGYVAVCGNADNDRGVLRLHRFTNSSSSSPSQSLTVKK